MCVIESDREKRETDEKKVPKTEWDDLCVFLHYKNFLLVCICTGILYVTLI